LLKNTADKLFEYELTQFLKSEREENSKVPDLKLSEIQEVVNYKINAVTVSLTKNPEFDLQQEINRRLDELSFLERGQRVLICTSIATFGIWAGKTFILPILGFKKIGILLNSPAAWLQSIFAKFGITIPVYFSKFQSITMCTCSALKLTKIGLFCGFDKRDLDNIVERSTRYYEDNGKTYVDMVNNFVSDKFDALTATFSPYWKKINEISPDLEVFSEVLGNQKDKLKKNADDAWKYLADRIQLFN